MTRLFVKSTVTDLVARKWAAVHGKPCGLSEEDLWDLVSGRNLDSTALPRSLKAMVWEDMLHEVLPESESMQDLLEDLRSLRGDSPSVELSEPEKE